MSGDWWVVEVEYVDPDGIDSNELYGPFKRAAAEALAARWLRKLERTEIALSREHDGETSDRSVYVRARRLRPERFLPVGTSIRPFLEDGMSTPPELELDA